MSDLSNITDDQLAAIRAEVFAGRKIQAIKLYREAAHTGLKEAKDVIEAFERELRHREPEQFTARKSGCAAMILLACSLAAVGAAAMR